MGYLFKDKDGNKCAAKTAFMITLMVCLIKVVLAGVSYNGLTLAEADYTGMAALLSPLAALYWGRANTKENGK